MSQVGRDQRLDLFRGLALIFIFIDHIPGNPLANFTFRSLTFFDAAEVFVFISGYTVALVFGRSFLAGDVLYGAAQVLRRCWTIYVAHIFLFVIFVAQVSWTMTRFDNPMFAEEMNVASFLTEPHVAVVEGLLLRFQPTFLDILPLYIVLLLGFVPFVLIARLSLAAAVTVSALLYLAVQLWGVSLATWPEGSWYFNPFAWQLLFCIGSAMAIGTVSGRRLLPLHPALLGIAGAVLLLTSIVKLSWYLHGGGWPVPALAIRALGPLADKTTLDPLRLASILAAAYLVARLLPPRSAAYDHPVAKPLIACGTYSLHIFCLGVFLAFFGHFSLVELGRGPAMLIAVNLVGILAMIGVAYLMSWFKSREGGSRRPRPTPGPAAAAAE